MLQYKKIKLVLILLLLFTPVVTAVSASFNVAPAFAAIPEGTDSNNGGGSSSNDSGESNSAPDCVEIGVSVPGEEDKCVDNGTGDNNPIFLYLKGIIQFLAAGVGIAVTISLVIGGIQYMTSRGNPQATQAAIHRITNAVIALILFILMAAILNFLIPGGLF